MKRAAHLLALFALVSLARMACAQDNDKYFFDDDPKRWGTPQRVVPPDYPKAALAAGQTGYVDFEGIVGPLRDIGDLTFVPDSPASETFVDALKEVLRFWSFYPPLGPDCAPSPLRVKNRIWFEIQDGKPRITVTRSSRNPYDVRPKKKPISRVDPMYPRRARAAGLQAFTYARMDVDPEGKVSTVTTAVFPRMPTGAANLFERANEEAFLEWRFEPGEVKVACMEVFYRLRD